MTNRFLFIGAAAGALVLSLMVSSLASAAPVVGTPQIHAGSAQLQRVADGYRHGRRYYRRNGVRVWAPFTDVDTHRGTYVDAPFARVYSGRRGTYVRAPFVDLFVPR